jgi:hypothetical protein
MQIGQHKVSQGNIAGAQVNEMLAGEKVYTLYSDPPWGDSYLKMFQTHTYKATGVRPPQINHTELCQRYADLVSKYVTDYVFIETSYKCADEMIEHIGKHTSSHIVKDMTYGNGLKAVLICFTIGNAVMPEFDIRGLKQLPFVKTVLNSIKKDNAIILDPCCGAGYTAKATLFHNMIFRGNELNPARLQKTIEFLNENI